ncbi:hypothetical protein [Chthonobacter rhizosphaerae]|uniref:hypothetical protein n=1 Tax=Chthonobacter rhizosphaerae TaxID=2735553 RepID=UPI0015EF038D|nr:hypothetical protein [Chthonobacter rhizosphaerae]
MLADNARRPAACDPTSISKSACASFGSLAPVRCANVCVAESAPERIWRTGGISLGADRIKRLLAPKWVFDSDCGILIRPGRGTRDARTRYGVCRELDKWAGIAGVYRFWLFELFYYAPTTAEQISFLDAFWQIGMNRADYVATRKEEWRQFLNAPAEAKNTSGGKEDCACNAFLITRQYYAESSEGNPTYLLSNDRL